MKKRRALDDSRARAIRRQVPRRHGDQARNAGRLMRAAKDTGVPKATAMTDHAMVLRAQASWLDQGFVQAQRAGDLDYFNRSYRQYRLPRAAASECAMSYTAARSIGGVRDHPCGSHGMATPITTHIFESSRRARKAQAVGPPL
jgi:hypothetical protein